jgi:hypothetical protein
MKKTSASNESGNPPGQTLPPAPVERLAYSVHEAAAALGVAEITVRRLLVRGLLKSAPGLRTKVIPRSSIDGFLAGRVSV